jgi:hypothetical protein
VVWGKYGIYVSHMAPGASSVMADMVFVIDKTGRIRQEVRDNPGPGTVSTRSSFAVLLASVARQALRLRHRHGCIAAGRTPRKNRAMRIR